MEGALCSLNRTLLGEHHTPGKEHCVPSSELLLGSTTHQERNTVLLKSILGSTTHHGRNTVFSLPGKEGKLLDGLLKLALKGTKIP